MRRTVSIFVLFTALALSGCGEAPPLEDGSGQQSAAISWFEGGVEEAFAAAKSSGKPVFLYWGAEWCPPCHNLKHNTFSKPQFIEAIRRFVPVYLDGDTRRAQLWAEKYEISGYPTVILFSPTGVELFRMPSDVTTQQYSALLESVVADFRPVHQILDKVLAAGPETADALELELIAFHSWGQDPRVELSDQEALQAFWTIYSETPAASERLRSRFLTLTLERAMAQVWTTNPAHDDVSLPSLDDRQRVALRAGLMSLMGNPGLWPENKIFLTLQSRRAVECLEPEPSPGRGELVRSWLEVAHAMQDHPEFSATEQLMAFVPEFELVSFLDAEEQDAIRAVLQDRVRERVDSVVTSALDPGDIQSTLNMLVWLMSMAGLENEAAALLDEHVDETAAPHYFLSILGDLSADNPETALEWHRLAFERSGHGSARVKWGSAYVSNLVRLAPEDAEAIEAASRELIAELGASEDAFAGRNHGYLQELEQALVGWAEATGNEAVIDRLRTETRRACDHFKGVQGDSQYERCQAFLGPDPPQPG